MNRLLHMLSSGFTGFILGYVLAEAVGQWTWLDMRFNIALLIPAVTLAGLLAGFITRRSPGMGLITCLESFWLVVTLLIYREDLKALNIIPAVLFREGFGVGALSLSQVNTLLLIVVFSANGALYYKKRYQS